MVSREVGNILLDHVRNAGDPIGMVFEQVVTTNRLCSSMVVIPQLFVDRVREYSRANRADGIILEAALKRAPVFREGGWVVALNSSAGAMTLDRHVFFGGALSLTGYLHELVHVAQYAVAGRTRFLVSYFGLSAAEIARRLLLRRPLGAMKSSPHETQAYALEDRFADWLEATYPGQLMPMVRA
ncbi:MAG TPA: hypothetical protein VFQ61_19615 [Polyangiaceae bacterium]|nr:hypothetical protein [Polyangiaceae bacterium]